MVKILFRQVLDYKVADLRKKLNKLRYQSKVKRDRIESLMKEYEQVVNMNAEMVRFLLSKVHFKDEFWRDFYRLPKLNKFGAFFHANRVKGRQNFQNLHNPKIKSYRQ